jgi:hypothetical protein
METKGSMRIKVISLWEPWGVAMRLKLKRNETRSWFTGHRGWLGIHSAKKPYRFEDYDEDFNNSPFNQIHPSQLLYGTLHSIAWLSSCSGVERIRELITEQEAFWGNYDDGRFAWMTDGSKLIVLPEPIPLRGAQGLFDWEVPQKICQQFPQLMETEQYQIGANAR